MTDEERTRAAQALFAKWTSKAMTELQASQSPSFATEMGKLAFDNVFAKLWVRPGLDVRSRSLVTLGILIALRATDELELHFPIALANGCTIQEIEEIIYQATAYAGFPAANAARAAATKSFRKQGLID
ncbi:MAG: carboxymuconolactone decarboxylase family protein [Myxococcota bacterium]